MLSVTLDTSCALNFLNPEEAPDDGLMTVISLGLQGRLRLHITSEAAHEVNGDEHRPAGRHAGRLKAIPALHLPNTLAERRDLMAKDLLAELFPNCKPDSRTADHNLRDCRQVAAHDLLGRDVFLTLDKKLANKRELLAARGIKVMSPGDLAAAPAAEALARPEIHSITLRPARRGQDDAAVRRVLNPLGDDYPNFDAWVTRQLDPSGESRIIVGEREQRVAAVAISKPKDNRVIKLGAFYVDQLARNDALGSHLLWTEIQGWAREGFAKAYVTVASRHERLLRFFAGFGFLIEGVSRRRYSDTTAEFVLGKHLLHDCIDDQALQRFAEQDAPSLLGLPTNADGNPEWWFQPPRATTPRYRWSGEGPHLTLVAEDGHGAEVRRWSIGDLERLLYPVRFALTDRQALVVPIKPRYADALLEYVGQQAALGTSRDEQRLLLRTDNVYYGYPKSRGTLVAGTPILFYVSEISAVVGEARLFDAQVSDPDDLYLRFGNLGIYELADIRQHVNNDGHAVALRFSMYVPFARQAARQEIRRAAPNFNPQGLTPVSYETYEQIRRIGGLTT